MKNILLFLTVIISVQVSAQKADDVVSLKKQIDSLQQRLDEANYVRIPKQDFEKYLQNSVQREVSDSVIELDWVFGIIDRTYWVCYCRGC